MKPESPGEEVRREKPKASAAPLPSAQPCNKCGAEAALDALWGLCARCLYLEANDLPAGAVNFNAGNRRFGDYELREALGRGGMGVVYEARQISLRRPVALKMIVDSEAASPRALRRFTLEAEVAAKLDHPNIVPIYEVGEHNDQPFLSMKLIAGEDLRKKIANGELCLTSGARSVPARNVPGANISAAIAALREGPRPSATSKTELRQRAIAIARFVAVVARAVHHAHENGILHRDLKPANILVDREGQPHLTDFGLAKVFQPDADGPSTAPLTLAGTPLGTPSYMSPEQATGKRLAVASDIYSVGAILYEMLAGQPPFQAATVLETLRLVSEQEPKRPSAINPRIDPDLETICMKCLEKNPDARYRSARALAEDLERWLRQEPIHARRAGILLRTRRWVARNPMPAALIVSLFMGLTVALVLLQQTRTEQKRRDLIHAGILQRFSREVDDMWKDNTRQFVLLSSPDLAVMANLTPRRAHPATTRLTLGLNISHEPLGQAMQYAPFLNALEGWLEKTLRYSVLIDLRLYKSATNSIRDSIRGTLDVQRLGAFSYVLAKQSLPGLEPVVRERCQKEAVIFARKDTGISTLAQVAARRVAFGQTNSSITFWAKVHLARAGVHGADLKTYVHLSGVNTEHEEEQPDGSQDRDSEVQAHKRVIQEVLLGRADVGEGPRRNFETWRYRRGGLLPLHTYQVTPDVYVARPGLDPEMVAALRKALVSLQSRREKTLLAKLNQNVVIEGFEPVQDGDFDDIRSAMTHELAEFENGAAPKKSE